MALPVGATLFGLVAFTTLLVTGAIWYRNRNSAVPSSAGVLIAVGFVVFVAMAGFAYDGAKATYVGEPCNDSEFPRFVEDARSFESLSSAAQDVFRASIAADDSYRTLREPADFRYVSGGLSANEIRYDGQCYALLARPSGNVSQSLLFSLSMFLIGTVHVGVGLRTVQTGERTIDATALLVGTGAWILGSLVLWPVIGASSVPLGAIEGGVIAFGVVVLDHYRK